jgi:hypothetical protein
MTTHANKQIKCHNGELFPEVICDIREGRLVTTSTLVKRILKIVQELRLDSGTSTQERDPRELVRVRNAVKHRMKKLPLEQQAVHVLPSQLPLLKQEGWVHERSGGKRRERLLDAKVAATICDSVLLALSLPTNRPTKAVFHKTKECFEF